MAKDNDSPRKAQPLIRFGDDWMPAHDAWKKMETATVVLEAIARFNKNFPELASADTLDVVPVVRQRLRDIELRMPDKTRAADLGEVATALLNSLSPEQAIDALAEQHGAQVDVAQLVRLVGEKAYLLALRRDMHELELNKVSLEQMAQLWNDAGRPAPGGGLWTSRKITQTLAALS